MKARRAPIPLDFKHPISTNTVPVGLFKGLANGNGSSNGHSENASIAGDPAHRSTTCTLPAISHKATRGATSTAALPSS
ncbi:hypothetical protein EDB85DRAFT_2278301 [Lactarius pseudohatsudake]|nr:hypothetical protein EDB85DRAFT_2278301 [Lactarius pseudohatsudake]